MFTAAVPGLFGRVHHRRKRTKSLPESSLDTIISRSRCVACLLGNDYDSCRDPGRLATHTCGNFVQQLPNKRFIQRRNSITTTARTVIQLKPKLSSFEMTHRRNQRLIRVTNFKAKSDEFDSSNGAMIVGQKGTTQLRRSPTPPPNQLRSTKLNEKSKSRNMREQVQVGNTTKVQLLSSRKFGSVGGLENSKTRKPTRILAGISKLWSKSHNKNTLGANDLIDKNPNSTETHPNGNKPRNAISQTSLNLHAFPQVQYTATSYRCAFSNYDNEAFAARLWEEYEEVISSKKCNTDSLRREKKQDRNSFERRSFRRRNSSLPTTQVTGQSILERISGLEELIHEPQSLKDFLSVKYLVLSFRKFLLTEFSEENLDFWLECEEYKQLSGKKLFKTAFIIYEKYVKRDSLREVNITVDIRKGIEDKLDDPDPTLFEDAQSHVYALMSSDSYKRFLKSDVYADLIKTFPQSTSKRKRRADAIRASFNKKLRR